MRDALAMLAAQLRIDRGAFRSHGLKDRRAITQQHVSLPWASLTPERLERLNEGSLGAGGGSGGLIGPVLRLSEEVSVRTSGLRTCVAGGCRREGAGGLRNSKGCVTPKGRGYWELRGCRPVRGVPLWCAGSGTGCSESSGSSIRSIRTTSSTSTSRT